MRTALVSAIVGCLMATAGCGDDGPTKSRLPDEPAMTEGGAGGSAGSGSASTTSCEGAPAGPACAAGDEVCITMHYFSSFEPVDQQPCREGPVPRIGGKVRTSLFYGPLECDDALSWHTRGLARFYAPYELTFSASALPGQVAFDAVMQGTEAEIRQSIVDAGLDPDSSAQLTAAQQDTLYDAIGKVLYRDLRAFMASNASSGQKGVNIVVVRRIASADVVKLMNLKGEIAGLGLSPAVLMRASGDDPNDPLYRMLGLPADFTPTLFVGHEVIDRLLSLPDLVIAHEMGHALGLVHASTSGNLLTQGQTPGNCKAYLTQEQVDALVGVEKAQVIEARPALSLIAERLRAAPLLPLDPGGRRALP